MGREAFRELFKELTPLIEYLSNTSSFKKLRFTPSDMVGFFNEKLYDVWLKYGEQLAYEEVKALSISSLYNYRGKIYKKYSREISLEEEEVDQNEYDPPTDIVDSTELVELAKEYLSERQVFVLELLVDPPLYIKGIATPGKRIPSHLLLDYLDLPTDKPAVKLFNTFRRNIFTQLESRVSQCT